MTAEHKESTPALPQSHDQELEDQNQALTSKTHRPGNFQEVLNQNKEFLNSYLKECGLTPHPRMAQYYDNIAFAYMNVGRFEDALVCHEKALDIQLAFYQDETHAELAKHYRRLEHCYKQLGNTKLADLYSEKKWTIYRQFLPPEKCVDARQKPRNESQSSPVFKDGAGTPIRTLRTTALADVARHTNPVKPLARERTASTHFLKGHQPAIDRIMPSARSFMNQRKGVAALVVAGVATTAGAFFVRHRQQHVSQEALPRRSLK